MKEANQDVKDQVCFATAEFKNLLTLEQICQYEACLYGEYQLKQLGLTDAC